MRSTKSQFFSLDVITALVILLLGIAIIFYVFPNHPNYYFTDKLSEDITAVLDETKLGDLCSDIQTDACNCQIYGNLTSMVCEAEDKKLYTEDLSILEMFVIMIETASEEDTLNMQDLIHEIFVEKNIVDERRYGFALIYTSPKEPFSPKELYNTETYKK